MNAMSKVFFSDPEYDVTYCVDCKNQNISCDVNSIWTPKKGIVNPLLQFAFFPRHLTVLPTLKTHVESVQG